MLAGLALALPALLGACTPLAPTGVPGDGGDGGDLALDGAAPSDEGPAPLDLDDGNPPGDSEPGPRCEPPLEACAGGCVDVTQSRTHCGRCGRDCQEGECAKGQCTPVLLASGLGSPIALAVNGAHVYVIEQYAAIHRVPKDGGEPQRLADGQVEPVALAVDGNGVYWVDAGKGPEAGALRHVGHSGGPVTDVLTRLDGPRDLATDGDSLFFILRGGKDSAGEVLRIGRTNVGGKPTLLASGQRTPIEIARDRDYVYWLNRDDDSGVGGLHRVRAGGGLPVPLAESLRSPEGLAVDDTHVYYSSQDPVTEQLVLWRVAKGGGEPEGLVRPPADSIPRTLADADAIYFLATSVNEGDAIWRQPRDGSPAEPLVQEQEGVYDLAQDERNLYWASFPLGTLHRVAK